MWTVTVENGKYMIFGNGQPICYGIAYPKQSCEDILREFCGSDFKKVC